MIPEGVLIDQQVKILFPSLLITIVPSSSVRSTFAPIFVQGFPDIGIQFRVGAARTAVNHHGLPVTKHNGTIPLAYIQEVHLQIRQRDHRQKQENQDKRCNPLHCS